MDLDKKITLKRIEKDDRSSFMEYLLLADERELINDYIYEGDMYAIHYQENVAGIVLFTFHPNNIVEVKNIAFITQYRGLGLGKLVLNDAFERHQAAGLHKMIVGTANSSIGNLAFYQKSGFRMAEIRKDFFSKYPQPIFENGIEALDMVVFERKLK